MGLLLAKLIVYAFLAILATFCAYTVYQDLKKQKEDKTKYKP